MKDKAPLSLMELGLMLLVFAMAAALCLQAFAEADALSRENEERDRATLLAQTAAETLKHCRGDYGEAARFLGGSWNGEALRAEENGLSLFAVPETAAVPTLGKAAIRVVAADGQELASLSAAWQEVTVP